MVVQRRWISVIIRTIHAALASMTAVDRRWIALEYHEQHDATIR